MKDVSDLQRFLSETLAARERAESIVQGLISAREECERQLRKLNRVDILKSVTGRSALDNSIAAAKRMIDSLDRTIEQVRRDLAQQGVHVAQGLRDTAARFGGGHPTPAGA